MDEPDSFERARLSRRSLIGRSAVVAGAALAGSSLLRGEEAAREGPGRVRMVPASSHPATVQDIENGFYSATNTSFGTSTTSGSYSDCAVVFEAPASGRVLIHFSGALRNTWSSASPCAYLSPEVRSGATIGSGTVVLAADTGHSLRTNHEGSETVRAGATHLLSGLTPGNDYNARLLHKVTSQTGDFFDRSIIVAPAT